MCWFLNHNSCLLRINGLQNKWAKELGNGGMCLAYLMRNQLAQ